MRKKFDGIKQYMRAIPAYDLMFFRVAELAEPRLPAGDLIICAVVERAIFDDILAPGRWQREHGVRRATVRDVYRPGQIDGMLIGAIGNRQDCCPNYPVADYPGIGGKLDRRA